MGISIFNTTTIVGTIGATAYGCCDHEKGKLKFTLNKDKAKKTLKNVGTTAAVVTLSSTTQFGGELATSHMGDLYGDAMSAKQVAQIEELLDEKEREFNGKDVIILSDKQDDKTLAESNEDAKIFTKKI